MTKKSTDPACKIVSETATGGVLYEKVFLEISQNSQESTCGRVSFLISKNTFFIERVQETASFVSLTHTFFDFLQAYLKYFKADFL